MLKVARTFFGHVFFLIISSIDIFALLMNIHIMYNLLLYI